MTRRFHPLCSSKLLSGTPEQVAKKLSELRFPLICSPKYDGWRLFEYGGLPTTRGMKQPKNRHTTRVLTEFYARVKETCGLVGIDGEAVAGEANHYNAMQNSTSAFNSFEGEPEFTYFVFDSYQHAEKPYNERWDGVVDCLTPGLVPGEFPWVQLVPQVTIHNLEDLLAYEAEQIALGWEGIMGRRPDGIYKMGRSTDKEQILFAIKRWESSEGIILEVREQMANLNEATTNLLGHTERSGHKENLVGKNTMGSVLVRDRSKFDDDFSVGYGRGLDDALRKRIWENPQDYVGQPLTYHYQDIGQKTRPRHPRWGGIRARDDMEKKP